MSVLASTLPNSNDGYVAAAYIVFFAIVLIYVAIMAIRLGRVERRLGELNRAGREPGPEEEDPSQSDPPRARVRARADTPSERLQPGALGPADAAPLASETQERETV
jgi:hypothetical protein